MPISLHGAPEKQAIKEEISSLLVEIREDLRNLSKPNYQIQKTNNQSGKEKRS